MVVIITMSPTNKGFPNEKHVFKEGTQDHKKKINFFKLIFWSLENYY
jgi:hypothetical protein